MQSAEKKPRISVIIPTLNEEENIAKLLPYLNDILPEPSEVIVADGQSSDQTKDVAKKNAVKVVEVNKMCRAAQMNAGAKAARSELLYFLHADAKPPKDFFSQVQTAIKEGFDLGCFRFTFDSKSWILAVNAYFTRFDRLMCRGGDQSLFIKKEIFEELGGYREDYRIMEDYEFIIRARKKYPFKIIGDAVEVSARKYRENSYLRVNFANLVVFTLFRWGAEQKTMINAYRRLLNHPKSESLN